MLDPTKAGFEKVGFEKVKSQKSDSRKVRSGIQKKGAFERLHAKRGEVEQIRIREKSDSKNLDSQKVGFEKSWIRKNGFEKMDSQKG